MIPKISEPQRKLLLELAQKFDMNVSPSHPPAAVLIRLGYATSTRHRTGGGSTLSITVEGSERAVRERSLPSKRGSRFQDEPAPLEPNDDVRTRGSTGSQKTGSDDLTAG